MLINVFIKKKKKGGCEMLELKGCLKCLYLPQSPFSQVDFLFTVCV